MTPLANDSAPTLLKMGLGFIFVGLAFKVAAAPFHLWTPDVYEGAPAPVTALLSTGPKAAAFALALRILANVDAAGPLWFWALWVAAVLSMFAGNLAALVQTSLKRMLAYSSIAHAGYILVALAAAAATDHPEAGIAAALFYLVGYALVKLGAFLIVAQLGGAGERHVEIEDFAGLARRQPAMAACLSLFLLSLLGLPVTAGFLGKFYVFNAALESNLIWLAILLASEQRDRSLLLPARDRRHVYARAQTGNRSRTGPVDALPRPLDRLSGHGVCRIVPRPRHRLRRQSRTQHAVTRQISVAAHRAPACVVALLAAQKLQLEDPTRTADSGNRKGITDGKRRRHAQDNERVPSPQEMQSLLDLQEDDGEGVQRHRFDQHEPKNERETNRRCRARDCAPSPRRPQAVARP